MTLRDPPETSPLRPYRLVIHPWVEESGERKGWVRGPRLLLGVDGLWTGPTSRPFRPNHVPPTPVPPPVPLGKTPTVRDECSRLTGNRRVLTVNLQGRGSLPITVSVDTSLVTSRTREGPRRRVPVRHVCPPPPPPPPVSGGETSIGPGPPAFLSLRSRETGSRRSQVPTRVGAKRPQVPHFLAPPGLPRTPRATPGARPWRADELSASVVLRPFP